VGETVPIEVVLHVLLPYLAITAYTAHGGSSLVESAACTANLCCSVVSSWNRCTGAVGEQRVGPVARAPEAHPLEQHSTPRLIAVLNEWI